MSNIFLIFIEVLSFIVSNRYDFSPLAFGEMLLFLGITKLEFLNTFFNKISSPPMIHVLNKILGLILLSDVNNYNISKSR